MQKTRVKAISAQGSRDTKLVGLARLGSAICWGGALVAAGHLFDHRSVGTLIVGVVFAVAAGLLAAAEIVGGGRAARSEERRLRQALLARQFRSVDEAVSAREEFPPGRVIQMLTDGVERVTEFRQVYFGSTLAAMMIPVVALLYIGIFIDPVVGFVGLILVPVIPLAIGGFLRLFRRTSANSRRQRGALAGRYLDAIRNLVTIRMFGAGERIERELRADGEHNRRMIMRLLGGNQVVIIVMDGIFSLVLICAIAWLTVIRGVSPGEGLTIMLLTVLMLEPLQQVAGFFYIGMGGLASQKEIGAYLRANGLASVDEAAAKLGDLAPEVGTHTGPDIAVDGVRFSYGQGEVLRGVSLEVPCGTRAALVGPSGVGKSTLIGLLRGSLPAQEGSIRVAGKPISELTPRQVRGLSASVSQSTWMFTGTIADNLRLARPQATEAEMWEALELAHVAEEVRRMPRGLETYLGEGAQLVSGGQAQRISLARALLSGRRILILDEPTSQVDIESESRIIEALSSLPSDWTVLVSTHRLALLDIADRVYEMDGGHLKEKQHA
ncbi:ABC transporter ATP-binding protein [Actinomyces sp. F1_1611]